VSVSLAAAQRSAAVTHQFGTAGGDPPALVLVDCPPLSWVADDRPPVPWATHPRGVEHALVPGAYWTLCGRGVWQFVEGTPANPHVGRITSAPRWPLVRRCRQCARRAVTAFTLDGGHLYDGTRRLPLCGRDRPRSGSGPLCGVCARSYAYVTGWRGVPVPALPGGAT
jgi:hypothetical protein